VRGTTMNTEQTKTTEAIRCSKTAGLGAGLVTIRCSSDPFMQRNTKSRNLEKLNTLAQRTLLNALCSTHFAQRTLLNSLCSTHFAQRTLLNSLCSTHFAQRTLLNALCSAHYSQRAQAQRRREAHARSNAWQLGNPLRTGSRHSNPLVRRPGQDTQSMQLRCGWRWGCCRDQLLQFSGGWLLDQWSYLIVLRY